MLPRTSVVGDCSKSLALAILSTVDCNIFSCKINYFLKDQLNGWAQLLSSYNRKIQKVSLEKFI